MDRVVIENNFLAVPAPVPPPVAGNSTSGLTGVAGNNDDWESGGGGCEGTREQCAVRDGTRDGTRGPGHVMNGDGSEENSQPNIGKDLTDNEKAELGGSGSGTPGGWEPQDEENARKNDNNFDRFKKDDLISSANEPINEQGLSAAGRAWEKHAGRSGGVFEPLKGNPTQKSEAANQFVNEVLNNKNTVKTDLSRGGVEYRLPDGRGVRYNSDGSFSGFLDPKKPR